MKKINSIRCHWLHVKSGRKIPIALNIIAQQLHQQSFTSKEKEKCIPSDNIALQSFTSEDGKNKNTIKYTGLQSKGVKI